MAAEGLNNEAIESGVRNESPDREAQQNDCYQEIKKYVMELHSGGHDISFAQFVIDQHAFIIENSKYKSGYKNFWTHLFGKVIQELDVRTVKRRTNWKLIEAGINEGEFNSTTSSTSKISSGIPLYTEEKEFVNDIYTNKLRYPKWELATGRIVEDTMHTFVKQCSYEHSSHSLIFDIMDPCWKAFFTSDEMQELITLHKPQLESLPVDLKEYLEKFSGVHDLEKLIDIHMQKRFHPSQRDLYWVEKTVGEILELYYYHYNINNKTEADLVRRLWGFIEKYFDESNFYVISGEKLSVPSSNQMNENRSVPGVTPLLRRKTGTKLDILIKHLHGDFDVGEAGLSGGVTSTKYIKEANLKLSKSLKDVIWNLLKMPVKDTQNIRIPGFIINGTELTVKIMDVPSNNVCRVYTLGPMRFPLDADTFYNNIFPLITLVWQCKALSNKTLQVLNTGNNIFIPTIDNPVPTSAIPPCIPSPRKRKLSDVETD